MTILNFNEKNIGNIFSWRKLFMYYDKPGLFVVTLITISSNNTSKLSLDLGTLYCMPFDMVGVAEEKPTIWGRGKEARNMRP